MKDQVYSQERALGIIEESLGSSPRARMHEESMSRRAGSILQELYSEGKTMCPRICYMSCCVLFQSLGTSSRELLLERHLESAEVRVRLEGAELLGRRLLA
jgi:hypothetical protein